MRKIWSLLKQVSQNSWCYYVGGGENLCYFTVEGFVYHQRPPIQFVDFVSWRFVSNMSSQTLGLINISSYNLHRMNENFVIDQCFLNPTFDSHWHLCRQILSKMPHLVFVPPQHFWWFLFVKQFCQDTLVGVLFKEWGQCFFVENAHSWSIQNLNGHLRVKLDSIFTEFCKLCNLINGSLN